MTYIISRLLVRLILKVFFGFRVSGLDNLPARGPYIAACNHTSYLDPPAIGAAMPARAEFIARSDLFMDNRILRWWIKSIGCILVNRTKRDVGAMKTAIHALNDGKILAIFPEGTRSENGSLRKPRAGIGFLAIKTGAPIIPAYVNGGKKALPKHSKSLRPCPIHVYFGEKITPSCGAKNAERSKELYGNLSHEVMNRIADLKTKHGN